MAKKMKNKNENEISDTEFQQLKRAVDKSIERISDEMDVETGVKNPFTPTILEILNKERKFEELSEEDFIKYVNEVNKKTSKKLYYLDGSE
jgi:hypothetical protein